MVQTALKNRIVSPYEGSCFLLTTKHQKSIALTPSFESILGATIIEHIMDTDKLGTFSGEIERKGSALETVKAKCELSLNSTETDYALASEGSFGPHPAISFLPSNQEFLYLIDRKRRFHLYVTDVYMETNYQMSQIYSLEELYQFAEKALFPSHALIICPFPKKIKQPIFKGIETREALESAFLEARKYSYESKVWVETDMRAHFNPTRMRMISSLGEKLAHRLNSLCPQCQTPGWGKVNIQTGLPCELCDSPTLEIKTEIWGCVKCSYQEILDWPHNKPKGDPGMCQYCNP